MKTQLINGRFDLSLRIAQGFLLAAALALCAGPALAERPEGAGQGKPKQAQGKGQDNKRQDSKQQASKGAGERQGDRQEPQYVNRSALSVSVGGYFQPQQRSAVQTYYAPVLQSGRCPPGLAKKNNGCMPPGQAKAYTLGRPLAQRVIFYDVPPSVVVRIGQPPVGHRYVRVAADILLIAIGTGMVIDAIEDLGRL